MITSQRAELPSEISIYYATWTRLWLCAGHHLFGNPITAMVVCATPFRPTFALIVRIPKGARLDSSSRCSRWRLRSYPRDRRGRTNRSWLSRYGRRPQDIRAEPGAELEKD